MKDNNDDMATDFNQAPMKEIRNYSINQEKNNNDKQNQQNFEKQISKQLDSFKKVNSQHLPQSQTKQIIKKTARQNQININDKNIATIQTHKQQANVKQSAQSKSVICAQSQILQDSKQNREERLGQIISGIQKVQVSQVDLKQNKSQHPPKEYSTGPQTIQLFSQAFKSPTIQLNETLTQAQQSFHYFENFKLALTQPISSMNSSITFRLDNLKYCIGVGIALQEIVEKHQYDYKSTTATQLGHGLYIVTTQGYSWSHTEVEDDDAFRESFNTLYSGVNVNVKLQGENLAFKVKKTSFSMTIPSNIRQKYTLCFCAYLHQKTDAVSIVSQ